MPAGGVGDLTMSQKLQVVQAFDRVLVTEIPADDSHALETKVGSGETA